MPWLVAPLGAAIFAFGAYEVGTVGILAAALAIAAVAATISRPEIGIAVGLTLIPLGNLGFLQLPELWIPPWLPVAVWAAFLFALAVPRWSRDRGRTRLGFLLALYLLTLCLSITIGGEAGLGVSVFRSAAVGLMFYFAIVTFVRSRAQLVWVLIGVAAMSSIVGLAAVREFDSGLATDTTFITSAGSIVDRAAAGFGHPNSLGGFAVLVVPLMAAAAIAVRRLRWLFVPALILALAALYLSFSRASLVGVVIGAAFFLNKRRAMVAIPVSLLVAVLLGAPSLLAERFQTLDQSGSDLATRKDFWRVAGSVWAQDPLVGSGPGTFPERYAEAPVAGKLFLPNSVFQPPPHAHNVFLNELAERGLVGVTILLAALVLALHSAQRLWRLRDPWLRALGSGFLAALVGWLVHNLFDVTLVESPGTLFFVLLGMLSATCSLAARSGDGERCADA